MNGLNGYGLRIGEGNKMRERETLYSIEMQILELKLRLIGLTQQKDKLLGIPVAKRMIATVDVVPSTFSKLDKSS